MLLPTRNTALRRDLEKWLRSISIEPVVVGEFEDAAPAKVVATEGLGIIAVPTLVAAEAFESCFMPRSIRAGRKARTTET